MPAHTQSNVTLDRHNLRAGVASLLGSHVLNSTCEPGAAAGALHHAARACACWNSHDINYHMFPSVTHSPTQVLCLI
eukprot:3223909-Pleurochrysis_carterae.AAC.1